MFLAIGAFAGVLAGLLGGALTSTTLTIIFGVLGICVNLYMAFGRKDWALGEVMLTGAIRAGVSGLIGFLSVLMGIGGVRIGAPPGRQTTPAHICDFPDRGRL